MVYRVDTPCRGGSRIFERGGSILGLHAKKGGGSKRGSNFGPNVKKPTSWPKGGGPDPLDPPPPGSATALMVLLLRLDPLFLLS